MSSAALETMRYFTTLTSCLSSKNLAVIQLLSLCFAIAAV